MNFVEVAVLCTIDGFAARSFSDGGVGHEGSWIFADVDVMTFLGRLDKLLIVFEFAADGGSVDFLSWVAFLLVGTSGCVACADRRENGVGMMHVFDHIFTGHGREKFDVAWSFCWGFCRGGLMAGGMTVDGCSLVDGKDSCVIDGIGDGACFAVWRAY